MIIEVGPGKTYYTIEDAWRGLPADTGSLHILMDRIDNMSGIMIVPEDKGITEVTLDAASPHSVYCPGARFYANGIPLTVGKNLTLSGIYAVDGDPGFRFARGTRVALSEGDGRVYLAVGGLTLDMGTSVTLTALAIASLAGILLNIILPGNDYEFGVNPAGDENRGLHHK